MKLVPTTVTCMPHVSTSQEASNVAAEKAGSEMASNVLVSLQMQLTLAKTKFLEALLYIVVNPHS